MIHTEYEQLESLGSLSDTQWVIIRAPSLNSPVRVRKVSELRALLAVVPRGDRGPIYQGFPSMQYSQVKMAGSGSDHTLLVVGLDFLVEGATVDFCYACHMGSLMTR